MPGGIRQGTDGPGIFGGINPAAQFPVGGDGIAQTKPGSGPEFRNTPQHQEVVILSGQGNGSDFRYGGCKFGIGFVCHDENIIFPAKRKKEAHLRGRNSAGGWIVRITQHKQPGQAQLPSGSLGTIGMFHNKAFQILHIQDEILFRTQIIIVKHTSRQGQLTLILGISRPKYDCGMRMYGLYCGRDKLCGAVSHHNIFRIRAGIVSYRPSERRIVPVRISTQHIQMSGKIIFHERREPQRINICPKSRNLFLFYPVNLFYFFQITTMKSSHNTLLFREHPNV